MALFFKSRCHIRSGSFLFIVNQDSFILNGTAAFNYQLIWGKLPGKSCDEWVSIGRWRGTCHFFRVHNKLMENTQPDQKKKERRKKIFQHINRERNQVRSQHRFLIRLVISPILQMNQTFDNILNSEEVQKWAQIYRVFFDWNPM